MLCVSFYLCFLTWKSCHADVLFKCTCNLFAHNKFPCEKEWYNAKQLRTPVHSGTRQREHRFCVKTSQPLRVRTLLNWQSKHRFCFLPSVGTILWRFSSLSFFANPEIFCSRPVNRKALDKWYLQHFWYIYNPHSHEQKSWISSVMSPYCIVLLHFSYLHQTNYLSLV